MSPSSSTHPFTPKAAMASNQPGTFTREVIPALKGDDEWAYFELFDRIHRQLVQFAMRKLSGMGVRTNLRDDHEAHGLVDLAIAELQRDLRSGKTLELESTKSVIGLLQKKIESRSIDSKKRQTRLKRREDLQKGESRFGVAESSDGAMRPMQQIADANPGPAAEAELLVAVAEFRQELSDRELAVIDVVLGKESYENDTQLAERMQERLGVPVARQTANKYRILVAEKWRAFISRTELADGTGESNHRPR